MVQATCIFYNYGIFIPLNKTYSGKTTTIQLYIDACMHACMIPPNISVCLAMWEANKFV